MKTAVVCGDFDDLRSADVRFLQEAARLGNLHVLLQSASNSAKFPVQERKYFLEAIRYVHRVTVVPDATDPATLMTLNDVLVVREGAAMPTTGVNQRIIPDAQLSGFLEDSSSAASSGRKKVLVTGCFDWLHTGHIRFFEEVSELGDVYAVVGHDRNIRILKGAGHPQFPEALRRYMVGAIRFVAQALISTGNGWLDAEPEIQRLKPDIYAVNEDGDKPEKKLYCENSGIEYLVLQRLPKPGLPRRQSTDLRGF